MRKIVMYLHSFNGKTNLLIAVMPQESLTSWTVIMSNVEEEKIPAMFEKIPGLLDKYFAEEGMTMILNDVTMKINMSIPEKHVPVLDGLRQALETWLTEAYSGGIQFPS